jgi:hypothetical protein
LFGPEFDGDVKIQDMRGASLHLTPVGFVDGDIVQQSVERILSMLAG